ncbi:ankyrin repeat domain-containing protein 53 [Monodelphis domestica]|uniref:ankyrin repeat domain-containing protein 53 n=1 Tax=Monodelphis domestica TaxID=13616 RepID=UPI0024E2080B|nr:ankyrin repeat domain-containing protein 53 [Monodelphis domestica]
MAAPTASDQMDPQVMSQLLLTVAMENLGLAGFTGMSRIKRRSFPTSLLDDSQWTEKKDPRHLFKMQAPAAWTAACPLCSAEGPEWAQVVQEPPFSIQIHSETSHGKIVVQPFLHGRSHTDWDDAWGKRSGRAAFSRRFRALKGIALKKDLKDQELLAASVGNLEWLHQCLRSFKGDIQCDRRGFSALHLAAERGNLQCVIALVEQYKFPLAATTKKGWTPLHLALTRNSPGVALKCVQYLLNKGAPVNVRNQNGVTPLHLAALEGMLDCLKFLVKAGADVHAVDNQKRKGIDLCRIWHHRECARFLKDAMWKQDKEEWAIEMNRLNQLKKKLLVMEKNYLLKKKNEKDARNKEAFEKWRKSKPLPKLPMIKAPVPSPVSEESPRSINDLPGTPPDTTETPAITKESPRATKESPRATNESPGATKESPRATKESPQATKESPRATKESPRATKASPRATKASPRATKASPRVTKAPQGATKEKESPQTTKEFPQVTKESPRVMKESPRATKEFPRGRKESPLDSKESPQARKESPRVAKESPRVAKESPRVAKESPRVAKESPRVAKESPRVAKESPRVAKESPRVAKESTGLRKKGTQLQKSLVTKEAPRVKRHPPGTRALAPLRPHPPSKPRPALARLGRRRLFPSPRAQPSPSSWTVLPSLSPLISSSRIHSGLRSLSGSQPAWSSRAPSGLDSLRPPVVIPQPEPSISEAESTSSQRPPSTSSQRPPSTSSQRPTSHGSMAPPERPPLDSGLPVATPAPMSLLDRYMADVRLRVPRPRPRPRWRPQFSWVTKWNPSTNLATRPVTQIARIPDLCLGLHPDPLTEPHNFRKFLRFVPNGEGGMLIQTADRQWIFPVPQLPYEVLLRELCPPKKPGRGRLPMGLRRTHLPDLPRRRYFGPQYFWTDAMAMSLRDTFDPAFISTVRKHQGLPESSTPSLSSLALRQCLAIFFCLCHPLPHR